MRYDEVNEERKLPNLYSPTSFVAKTVSSALDPSVIKLPDSFDQRIQIELIHACAALFSEINLSSFLSNISYLLRLANISIYTQASQVFFYCKINASLNTSKLVYTGLYSK